MDWLLENDPIEDAWLGLNDDDLSSIRDNPLMSKIEERLYEDYPGAFEVSIMRKPEYIAFIAKVILGLDMPPFQQVMFNEIWNHPFPMIIGSRGLSKSFMLAFYAVMRTLLYPEYSVVLAGAGFRQSKLIFEYVERFWHQAPVLRTMCNNRSGISKDVDRWCLRLNDSRIWAIPVGTGETIRGIRANCVCCVDGDTLLHTDNGCMTARELYDSKDLSIKIYDGEQCQKNKNLIKLEKEAIRITTMFGYDLIGSTDHSIMTKHGWKKLEDCNIGDRVKITSAPFGTYHNPTYAKLFGYFLSEGSNSKHSFGFTNTKQEVINDIISCLNDLQVDYNIQLKSAKYDKRGFHCQPSTQINLRKGQFKNSFKDFFIQGKAWDKIITPQFMSADKETTRELLRSLFEGDGSLYKYIDHTKGKKIRLRVAYYTSSFKLLKQVQYLLLKFGIRGSISSRFEVGPSKKIKSKRLQYVLAINGIHAINFANKIGLSCTDLDISDINIQRPKNNSDYLRITKIERLPKQEVFDFTIPSTHKYLSNSFISHNCDEFDSHNPQIVEEVLGGFGAVSSSPVIKLKEAASNKKRASLGIPVLHDPLAKERGNQLIISGTAGYYFNHFYEYWKRYRKIISSKGDVNKLKEIFKDEIPAHFDWRDFSIIRIPYSILPDGFMEDKVIARAKSQMPSFLYQKEYEAVFIEDSDGFFKRSLIENCVASEKNIQNGIIPSWCPTPFDCVLRGYKDGEYIMAIDPAAEDDNLAIVIIENYGDHGRIVNCWTTNKKKFQERRKAGYTEIDDYFHFVVRKIRDLMSIFPCSRIAIDMQGGGSALSEALHNPLYMEDGEHQLWAVVEENKKKDTDDRPGLHIIEEIQFARADWVRDANYSLRKDMESKTILFPRFDPVSIELAIHKDKATADEFKKNFPGRELVLFDTLEDVVEEIEALKDELTTIQHTRTGTGVHSRERWDVPEVVIGPEKKTAGKKDRYSALLMANMVARTIREQNRYKTDYSFVGGLVKAVDIKKKNGKLYNGPEWASEYFK